jgi:8-oxo-dGTP diphosphatase
MAGKTQKIGVTAFILNGNKLLITRRSADESFLPGYYEMPGGIIEFGESPETALTREIKEETDLDIKIIKPYSTFSYISNKKHTIDIQFFVEPTSDLENIKLSSEHDEFKWVKKEEINNYKFSDQMKKVIIKGFNNLQAYDIGNKKTA